MSNPFNQPISKYSVAFFLNWTAGISGQCWFKTIYLYEPDETIEGTIQEYIKEKQSTGVYSGTITYQYTEQKL